MRITRVEANSRKRLFEVRTKSADLTFPFARADPSPSTADPVKDLYPDPELGHEGFTYELESGAEGTVHLDAVLEYNEAPGYMAELALYRLTNFARRSFDASPLSAREVARLLDTSLAQLYRLLDPTNYVKSANQLLSLLFVLRDSTGSTGMSEDETLRELLEHLWSVSETKRQRT